jgi:hypothetical protein
MRYSGGAATLNALNFATPGNPASRQRFYPTAQGLEADGSLTLRREVADGSQAPELHYRSKSGDGSFPFWLSGIDVANIVKGRDFVPVAKGDWPNAGNVSDLFTVNHRGFGAAADPTFAFGGWDLTSGTRLTVLTSTSDAAMGGLAILRSGVPNAAAKMFQVQGAAADLLIVQADGTTTFTVPTFKVQTVGLSVYLGLDLAGAGKARFGSFLQGFGLGFSDGVANPNYNVEVRQTSTNNSSFGVTTASWGNFIVIASGVSPGTVQAGTTNGTPLNITTNNVTRIALSATGGIGFFGAAAIAQPATIANADGTLADITAKFNTLLSALRAASGGLGLLA